MKNATINMEEELYLDEIRDIQMRALTPQKADEVERIFREIRDPNEKLIGLNILLVIFFHDKRYDEAMMSVEELVNDPEMAEYKAYLILKQGQISELQGDFDAALGFYCRSLTIGKWPEYVCYFLWNHIGFCWLFKQEFVTAEWCCRKAIEVNPRRGEAWKNLGVSLEHQGKFTEALQCYFKAFSLSERKIITVLHLRRIIRRRHGFIEGLKDVRRQLFKNFRLLV